MKRTQGWRSAAFLAGVALVVLGAQTAPAAGAEPGSVTAKPLPTRLAPDLAAHAHFGHDVAVDGDTLVVGAFNDRGPGKSSGSATVYVADESGWVEQARLVPLHPQNKAKFGSSVAVDGDTVVVGAQDRDEGEFFSAGAAYIFVRSGATWTEQAKLELTTLGINANAGWSVALQDDVAVVGVPGAGGGDGAVEIFTRSGTTWTQQAVLEPDAGDFAFGSAVAIDGDTIVVGQAGDPHQSAYVYVGSGAAWTRQAVLVAEDAEPGDYYGASVDVSGDTVVVSAEFDDVDGVNASGSAYVFTRFESTWTKQARLTASDSHANQRFGGAVAVDGATVAVGAYYYYGGEPLDVSDGAVYTFLRAGDEWTQRHLLLSRAGSAGHFGLAVDLAKQPSGGQTLAVGSSWEESQNGAAYVYRW